MSCCSTEHRKKNTDVVCPKCNRDGILVQPITPKSLIKEAVNHQVRPDLTYKYCKNESCDISYFTEDRSHYFTINDLKERPTLKDNGLEVKVCYCFGHTRQSVLSELKATGQSTVLEEIKSKMKDPGCFCEVSNPQGVCCLGNVTAWIKKAKKLITEDDSHASHTTD